MSPALPEGFSPKRSEGPPALRSYPKGPPAPAALPRSAPTEVEVLLAIYVTGVVIGLGVMRDPWTERIGTAVLWPLGILSLVVVAVTMIAAALYLWPILLLGLIPAVALLWLVF
jgi:hypothetical protein